MPRCQRDYSSSTLLCSATNKKRGFVMNFRDRHHRKPSSIGGKNDNNNISIVNQKQHRAWHILFRNKTAPEIAALINEFWIDPDYVIVVINVKEAEDDKINIT
jgi:hypothetical protein